MKRYFRGRNAAKNWLLFFYLLGFGLRVQQLDFQPLWGDEGWSFYLAAQPIPDLLALTAIDIHPPLYYLLLKGWLVLAGPGAAAARFFSMAAGLLLIPLLYRLGHHLFERRVGVAAAGLVALMPLAVYYAQEVRMYGLVTLLGVGSIYFFAGWSTGRRPGFLTKTAYVLTTTAALYTHYYAGLLVVLQFFYSLVTALTTTTLAGRSRQARITPASLVRFSANVGPAGAFPRLPRSLNFLNPFLYIGLLYSPWIIYVTPRLTDYIENKRAVEGYLPLDLAHFIGEHLLAFSLGHFTPAWRGYLGLALPLILVAVLGFITVAARSRRSAYRLLYLYLFAPLFLGYGINLIFPFHPPFYERTLLLIAPAYWLFMAIGLVWLWQRSYRYSSVLIIVLLLIISGALTLFYTVPRYPYEDYRPLLNYIAARATPADTILASYQWQFGFYQAYLPQPRPQIFTVPAWGAGWAGSAGEVRRRQDIQAILAHSPRLWFPAHQSSGHIWEDQAEAVMVELGYPALLAWYGPQTKLSLIAAPPAVMSETSPANFAGQLSLVEAVMGQGSYQAGRGIVPVALTWQIPNKLADDYRVSLRLAGPAGHTWATRDSRPRAGQIAFTDWPVGEPLLDRHGLLIPAGTPPGLYNLFLSVRRVKDAQPLDLFDENNQPQGAELLLSRIEVTDPSPPLPATALPVQVPTAAMFGREARLIGYSLGHGPFKAGQSLPLALFWQSVKAQTEPLIVSIQLLDQTGQTVVTYQQKPIRPAEDWPPNMLLTDPHEIPLPPTLAPGVYRLTVALLTPAQTPLPVIGSDHLSLTSITTIDRPHNFNAPKPQLRLDVTFGEQARLVGLDLPQTEVKPGETLPLTLYWQGVAPLEKSWKVFVHLIDASDQIISQQDQIPGAGQFPTSSWLPGEYLIDKYRLSIPAGSRPGSGYRLRVGLYDANDFSRLPVTETGQIINDHLVLAEWPISIE